MLPALFLSLREGLEIALVIGIVLGAVHKLGRPGQSFAVWCGISAAIALSVAAALALRVAGARLNGSAEIAFEGLALLLAASVLTWMIFWMSRQSRKIKVELEAGVRNAVERNGWIGLFWLAFFAVLREGVELALFLSAAAWTSSDRDTLLGTLLGLGAAGFLGWAIFHASLRLDLRRFFFFTGTLLILFAAGLVANGVHELIEIHWVPAGIQPLWSLNTLIRDDAGLGQILKTLFGYNSRPSLAEALAYLGYFAAIGLGLWIRKRTRLSTSSNRLRIK